MQRVPQSDEEMVERTLRVVATRQKLRWAMLLYAGLFLGLSGFFTIAGVRKVENLDAEQLKLGFVYGLALAVVWTSLGVAGAMCLGKFLAGFSSDFRLQELVVRDLDRLGDMGQLPDEKKREASILRM